MTTFDVWPRDTAGRLLCRPEHPMPQGQPMHRPLRIRWAHSEVYSQGGKCVCRNCGAQWTQSLVRENDE